MTTKSEPLPEFARFAESVRALRIGQKLSQQQLAEKAGVSSSTVSRAERAQQVFMGHALAISKALGRTLDELMQMSWDTCPRCGGSGVVHSHAEPPGLPVIPDEARVLNPGGVATILMGDDAGSYSYPGGVTKPIVKVGS